MGILAAVFVLVGILVIVVLVMAVGIYNALVALRNQVDRAWANIDVILKQRYDEIPQLLEVVQQYAGYEKAAIARVTEARQSYGRAKTTGQKVAATQELTLALQGVIAIGEAYPDLKANQSFIQLQGRVSQLEGDIADRREVFNESVTNLNTRIDQFPDMLFSSMLGYRRMELLKSTDKERSRPSLQMNLG